MQILIFPLPSPLSHIPSPISTLFFPPLPAIFLYKKAGKIYPEAISKFLPKDTANIAFLPPISPLPPPLYNLRRSSPKPLPKIYGASSSPAILYTPRKEKGRRYPKTPYFWAF